MALFRKETALTPARFDRDPFAMLRQMTGELDRMFDEPFFRALPGPVPALEADTAVDWLPRIEVIEKDRRLMTRIDLPGMKKDDVKVEVADNYLVISGERKREAEQKKDAFFRTEREYGSFYRAVPLPEDTKPENITATFADGVLEVSLPLPAKPEVAVRKVEIQEPPKAGRPAA